MRPYKRHYNSVKGPIFSSFLNQGTPDLKKQWIRHSGKRERMKHLRRACKGLIDSQDEQAMMILNKAKSIIGVGPLSEYGLLVLLFQAKETSDSTGLPFLETLDYIIHNVNKTAESPEAQKDAVEE